MSVVRPEFGPTLPELLRPRLAVLPRAARIALAVLGALLVCLLAWALLLRGGDDTKPVVVREPVALNFVFRAPFTKQPPQAGELARVGGGGQWLAVRELRLPAYRGDAAGFLPLYASQLTTQMERQYPEFLVRAEGRVNVNRIQGYELVFQFRRGGRLTYGRRIMLLPTTTARQGADLLLTAPRTPAIPRADAVGRNGALKTSLRSFRFGTERP
jgi:hypothetical protein